MHTDICAYIQSYWFAALRFVSTSSVAVFHILDRYHLVAADSRIRKLVLLGHGNSQLLASLQRFGLAHVAGSQLYRRHRLKLDASLQQPLQWEWIEQLQFELPTWISWIYTHTTTTTTGSAATNTTRNMNDNKDDNKKKKKKKMKMKMKMKMKRRTTSTTTSSTTTTTTSAALSRSCVLWCDYLLWQHLGPTLTWLPFGLLRFTSHQKWLDAGSLEKSFITPLSLMYTCITCIWREASALRPPYFPLKTLFRGPEDDGLSIKIDRCRFSIAHSRLYEVYVYLCLWRGGTSRSNRHRWWLTQRDCSQTFQNRSC